MQKAVERGCDECPICMNATAEGELMITNCSHVFHKNCLKAFEDFNIYECPLCPVCRAHYRAIPCQL